MENKQEFQQREPVFVQLANIRPREHCKNVIVKVVSVNHSTAQRRDGSDLEIAEGYIADDSKYLPFRVTGKFAQLLQVGNVVAFRNCRSEIFAGLHRLSVDRWGKITKEDKQIEGALTHYNKTKVTDLQPGVNGDNVAVRIISVEQKEENGRKYAEGTCGDETAIINFKVVGKSAEVIKEGVSVLFVNAKSEVHEETHRLGSGVRGRVITLEKEEAIANTNDSKNMSEVKYEKIVLHSDEEKKSRPQRDNRGPRRDNRDNRENRRDNRDNRDNRRDNRDNRDNRRDNRDNRRDNRDNRDNRRDNRDNRRDNRDNRDNRHRNERRHDGKRE